MQKPEIYDLEEILNDFEQNIASFIELCKDKIVVFDFDGTLTKFKYEKNRLLPCLQKDVLEYTLAGGNIYHTTTVLKTMQYIISKLNMNNLWVLTTSYPQLRDIKSKIIHQHFNIPLERIIHSNSDLHKVELLKNIHSTTYKKIIFVEDTVNTLLAAEDNLDFVEGYHISSLLA
ncbi:MAG: hypothetical protein E7016_05095 [Alphaproteobacteria bacterium]|nr:hypothetical protein [Alphaproteobacteria bacterium]